MIKEAINLKERKEGCMQGLEGGGKGRNVNNYNLKKIKRCI